MEKKPTQSRKGVKGQLPLAGSRDSVPCGVWGNAPTVPRQTYSKEEVNKVQAAKRPCPKLCASSDAPPSCSFDQLCCVAPNGRDRTAWLPVIAGLFRKQGISRLRARVGGFAVAPDTPSQCTPMRLDFHRCRGTRACGRESGALRSPPTPLRSAHPCSLIFIVAGDFASAEATKGHENRRMSAVALWKPSAPPLLGLIHLDDNRKR